MSTSCVEIAVQSSLAEQLATRLVQGPGDDDGGSATALRPLKACIAVAGGGSGAASAIASVPGASSLLLESIVTYDRQSYAEFVSRNVAAEGGEEWLVGLERSMEEQSKLRRGESALSSSVESTTSSASGGEDTFHFCSTESAILLSRAALHRSLQFTSSFSDQCLHCVGVGCTSSLVGKLSPEGGVVNGRKGRKSRAFVAISTLNGGTRIWDVELDTSNNPRRRRSRSEEEPVVSNLILLAMMRHREGRRDSSGDFDSVICQILDREGDKLAEKQFDARGVINDDTGGGEDRSAAWGASQIIGGDANVVVVLPVGVGEGESSAQSEDQPQRFRMEALFADDSIPFPRDVLIVPGSFNPPHQGHTGLANAAVLALRQKRAKEEEKSSRDVPSRSYSRYSSGLSAASSSSSLLKSLWSTVEKHSEEDYNPTVFFEMSVTNADKPPLEPLEVERRLNFFDSLPPEDLPEDWAVLLTNAPLFSQKTEILDELLAGKAGGSASDRRMHFVLGTDTMVRILNPKYYGDSRENMVAALVEMQEKGVHFIVGGRLEQGTGDGATFVNGEEEVRSLPPKVQQMFTLLNEGEFRLDISSTELRKRFE
ncbi:hypothetical protein ACHAXT_003721 [Thalassiosira profunda]